ncbi:hypothetical protein ACFY30_22325 [Streptomyces sp. NPDC000345]|uniref:hypothetical protein n=1 Tax=Streptomyces sp. NPDC000345 TaxID=3364537 RepID=UPI00368A2462
MGAIDSAVAWSVAIVALAGLCALVWRVLRAVLRIADWLDDTREDWVGAPARPGVPERPGVMTRLGQHDVQLDDHEKRITQVETRLPDTA